MFKKLSISFVLALFLLISVFVPFAKAEEGSSWYNQGFVEWSTKVFDQNNPTEIFGERYTFAQVQWITYSLSAILAGGDLLGCQSALGTGDLALYKDCIQNIRPVGLSSPVTGIASLTDIIITTHPASGINYLAEKASNLHIIPQASAQGFGFNTLSPVLTLWKVVRNISYFLLIIVVIVMAFMIMFRVKLSPQVVITIQSALPKIIISLILITFSYAIAGLIIDLSYVFIGLFALAIKTAGSQISGLDAVPLFNQLLNAHPLGSLAFVFILYFLLILGIAGATTLLSAALPIVSQGAAIIAGISLIVLIIFLILLLIISIRIFWLMLRTLINIILLIVAAPLMILLGTVSAQGGFSSWLRSLLANVVVYPVIIIMLFLCHFFFWAFFIEDGIIMGPIVEAFAEGFDGFFSFMSTGLNPYDISTVSGLASDSSINLPGFSFQVSSVFGLMLSFGLLMLVPSVANIVRSLIEGRPFAYGTAIGETATAPFVWGARIATTIRDWRGHQRDRGGRAAPIPTDPPAPPPPVS